MNQEQIICGYNAASALIEQRPEDILRLHFTAEMAPRFGPICKQLAASRRIYRTGTPEELESLSKSAHHGGVVVIARPRTFREPDAADMASWKKENTRILVFDQIGNTHNMGAMARSAAFLGVKYLITENAAAPSLLTPSATRVAEGGMEHLKIRTVPSLAEYLRSLPENFHIAGTDQNGKVSIDRFAADPRAASGPIFLVMGNEEQGLSPDVRAACRTLVAIPGCGAVESLNVVTAAAICMYVLSSAATPAPARRAPR